MIIPIKSFTCECGQMCTAPQEINPIYNEFPAYPIVDAILNIDGDTTILNCPSCGKTLYKVVKF